MKQHKWFEGFDWDALAARKIAAPRKPRDDAAKRIRELAVCGGLGDVVGFEGTECRSVGQRMLERFAETCLSHTITLAAGDGAQAAEPAQGDARGACRSGGGLC